MALDTLPELALVKILSFTDTSDSKSLIACCKRLRDYTLAHKPVAYNVRATSGPQGSHAKPRGPVASQQLRRLKTVFRQCPTLVKLKCCLAAPLKDWERYHERMDKQLSAMFKSMVRPGAAAAQTLLMNITHVTLQNMCVTSFLPLRHDWVPNLQHLILKKVDIRPHEDSHTLPTPVFPHLRDITLDSDCVQHSLPFTVQHVKQQLRSLPSLNSLHIKQGWQQSVCSISAGIEVVASQLTSLTCNDATPTSRLLAQPFPRLQCLTMSTWYVKDTEMELLLKDLPLLQQLSVGGFDLNSDYSGRVCNWSQLEVRYLHVQELLQLPLARVRQLQVSVNISVLKTYQSNLTLSEVAAALQAAAACGGLHASAAPSPSYLQLRERRQGVVGFTSSNDKEVSIAAVSLLSHFPALEVCADLSLDFLRELGQLPCCKYLKVRHSFLCLDQPHQLIQQMASCLPHVQVLEGADALCTEVRHLEALLRSVTRPITLRFKVDKLEGLFAPERVSWARDARRKHEWIKEYEPMLVACIRDHARHPDFIQYIID